MFTVNWQDQRSGIRTGKLKTASGYVETPAFVPVGTQATVKSVSPRELCELGISLFFVNTYHAYLRPGVEAVASHKDGLHGFMSWDRSLITDSGGFQVFSLGSKKYVNTTLSEAAVLDRERFVRVTSAKNLASAGVYPDDYKPTGRLVRIDDDGVTFTSHLDGTEHRFTPEISIGIQHRLDSDILIAFDECASYPVDAGYAREAMRRTHTWLDRSVIAHRQLNSGGGGKTRGKKKLLYGVVQGSTYEELRRESARYVNRSGTDGIAVGGVSVGESKEEMKMVLDWVTPFLDGQKPRHLLGVGEIDDIFEILEHGFDTFDCVQPTRLARMGELFIGAGSLPQAGKLFPVRKAFRVPITNTVYKNDTAGFDPNCTCPVCGKYSRSYLHHLFRASELLGYRLASLHNLHVMKDYVDRSVVHAKAGDYHQFKQTVLNNL